MKSINPYNGIVLGEFREHDPSDIENILAGADSAFRHWRNSGFEERQQYLRSAARLLEERTPALGMLITKEMGKRMGESESEIKKCAWVCKYYADKAREFLRDEKLPVDEADSYIAYDPLGPVLAVMPWNFPFWQVFRFAAPAVMAGNTGILKHASNVPQCSLAIAQIFHDAGFPEGVFQSVLIPSSTVNDLIDDKRIAAVTLTGSEDAGRSVAAAAGRNIKKSVLELGGSDPFIVLKDADIDRAARVAARARMINCGQSCIAAKRFIVHRDVSDDFIDIMEEEFLKLSPGDPEAPTTGYGPMARSDLTQIIEHQVNESIQNGAKLIMGGKRTDGFNDTFYMPTILKGVKPGMAAFDEELFGPVAAISAFRDEEEAIGIANHSGFGLGASLWSRDIEKGKGIARKIESGSVFINEMVASHPVVPFGGIKMSGYGRELSHLGIREFMNIKSVWIHKD